MVLVLDSSTHSPGEQRDREQQQQPQQQQQQRLPSDVRVGEHEHPVSGGDPDGLHHDNDHRLPRWDSSCCSSWQVGDGLATSIISIIELVFIPTVYSL